MQKEKRRKKKMKIIKIYAVRKLKVKMHTYAMSDKHIRYI